MENVDEWYERLYRALAASVSEEEARRETEQARRNNVHLVECCSPEDLADAILM